MAAMCRDIIMDVPIIRTRRGRDVRDTADSASPMKCRPAAQAAAASSPPAQAHIPASVRQLSAADQELPAWQGDAKFPQTFNSPFEPGTSKTEDNRDSVPDAQLPASVVGTLEHRLAAAEAESSRHVRVLASMHNWASQTAATLRQVQAKYEGVEERAQRAESEVDTLKQQMAVIQAQVNALAPAQAAPSCLPPVPSSLGEGGKRRRRSEDVCVIDLNNADCDAA